MRRTFFLMLLALLLSSCGGDGRDPTDNNNFTPAGEDTLHWDQHNWNEKNWG